MFNNLTQWFYPHTLDDALALLKKGEVSPHAGGTGLLRVKSNRITGLVDLKNLSLNEMTEDDQYYYIGACATFAQIAQWNVLEGAAAILKQAASMAASTPLRNRITIGGSIAAPPPWSDLPPVLLALNARIEVQGTAEGIYDAIEFFKSNPLDGSSLVTQIQIPKLPGKAIFKRITQTTFDYSMLDLALYIFIENNIIKQIRIALGCAVPRAIRLEPVENFLLNKEATDNLFAEAVKLTDFNPIEDKRASKTYRQQLLKTLLSRSFSELLI